MISAIRDVFFEVSEGTAVNSIFPEKSGQTILPADSNVSGTALIDLPGGQYSHDDAAVWKVRFTTPGTYQFIPRISVYETGLTPTNYGNEDSFWLPPSWNLNSSTDWIGFEKEHYNIENPDIELPEEGFRLDELGWELRTGDSEDDGRLEIVNWGIKSAGVLDLDAGNPSPNPLRDGNFVWYEKPMVSNVDSFDVWLGEYGHRTTYEVTPAQVGEVLMFEIGARETYGVLDGFAFVLAPVDANKPTLSVRDDDLLDAFTQAEVDALLETIIIPGGNPGDFNNDMVRNGHDLLVWGRGESPDPYSADDLAEAQEFYGVPISSATAVPEPATWLLLLTIGIGTTALRSRTS